MDQYVVIGFDGEYQRWGISSLISLRKLAKYQGKIIVVGSELSKSVLSRIAEAGAELVEISKPTCWRGSIFDTISSLAEKRLGIYAYWDADVYFQESIDEIFSLAAEKFCVTNRPGFLAAPHSRWQYLAKIKSMMSLITGEPNGNALFSTLVRHYPKLVQQVDDTWNFVDLPKLESNGNLLSYKGDVVKTIHPSGTIRDFTPNRNILFWERHSDLSPIKIPKTPRKIVRCTTQPQVYSTILV